MKILCTADIHIGQQTYSHLNPQTGLNTRVEYSLNILDNMIEYAIKNCDMFIFAGDMFKNNIPSPTIQNEVYKRIKRLSDSKIKTIIIDGNHDVSNLNTTKSSLKAIETFELPYITHNRFLHTETINNLDFVMLPTYTDKEELKNIVDNITKPSVLIGHFTVLGAALNSWLVDMNEANVSIETFMNPNVKAVILGHLHKFQVLNQNPLIFYTGSPDRIDFTEENDNKGFVVIDTDNFDYEFIENNAQKFCTIKIDINNIEDYNDYILINIDKYKDNIYNAVTRCIISLNSIQNIDENEIYKYIKQYNPTYILSIQKQYINKKYERNSDISVELDMNKTIELFYKNKDREQERINLAKNIASAII